MAHDNFILGEKFDIPLITFCPPKRPAHWRFDSQALNSAVESLGLEFPVSVTPMKKPWYFLLGTWGGDHTTGFHDEDTPCHVIRVNADQPSHDEVSRYIWHELGHAVQTERFHKGYDIEDRFVPARLKMSPRELTLERWGHYAALEAEHGYYDNPYEVDARSYEIRRYDHPLTYPNYDGKVWGIPYKIGGHNAESDVDSLPSGTGFAGMEANSRSYARAGDGSDPIAWHSNHKQPDSGRTSGIGIPGIASLRTEPDKAEDSSPDNDGPLTPA